MRRKKENRGSAMVIIIIVVAFVSILISTLYSMVVYNLQMKGVNLKSKNTFYSAESVLDGISLGLQKDLSGASEEAYSLVVRNYMVNPDSPTGAAATEDSRRAFFVKKVKEKMKAILKGSLLDDNRYDVAYLEQYLVALGGTVDATTGIVDLGDGRKARIGYSTVPEVEIDPDALAVDEFTLKGVEITYWDAEGFETIIETDITVSVPRVNFIAAVDLPDMFQYSIIANQTLQDEGASVVRFADSVYAGKMELDENAAWWKFENAARLIVSGETHLKTNNGANKGLTVSAGTDYWANRINIEGGKLEAAGRTFVEDDMVLSGDGSTVKLSGEYYGYGNGTGTMPSSAILVNGINTNIDMSGLNRLMISGNAQLATNSEASINSAALTDVKVPLSNDNLESKLIESPSMTAGSYSLFTMASQMYWSSGNDGRAGEIHHYWQGINFVIGRDNWERFSLIPNEDGTISFYDHNNQHKYISVQDDGQLVCNSDTITAAEKFKLYLVEGESNLYAMKSVKTGKYVRDQLDGRRLVYADSNTITGTVKDSPELRRIRFVDTIVEPTDPTVTVQALSDTSALITAGLANWSTNPNGASASITYKVGNGVKTETLNMTKTGFNNVTLTNKSFSATMTGLKDGETVDYTIKYSYGGQEHTYSGYYVHRIGTGNSGTKNAPALWNGQYAFRTSQYNYYMTINNWRQLAMVYTDTPAENAYSIQIVNVGDSSSHAFVFFDGTNYARLDGDNLVFDAAQLEQATWLVLEHVQDDNYYIRLYGQGRYLSLNPITQYTYLASFRDDVAAGGLSAFKFRYTAYASAGEDTAGGVKGNTTPIYDMIYVSDEKVEATISLPASAPYTIQSATLTYNIGGGTDQSTPMVVSNGVGSAVINNGLGDGVTVSYTVSYTCSDGVTRNVSRNSYIHRFRNKSVNVSAYYNNSTGNPDINLGESLEIKSNQIAYLVPGECIGVENGTTLFGKNPMTLEEYAQMALVAADTGRPNFTMVDFNKEISGLNGHKLSDYVDGAAFTYRTVFSQSLSGSTMVYFYVNFAKEKSSEYFIDYYNNNKATMDSYMNNYINSLNTNSAMSSVVLNGNMISSGGGESINIKKYGNLGVSPADRINEETTYENQYTSLCATLKINDGVTAGTPYTNLVKTAAVTGVTGERWYETTYGADPIKAVVVNGNFDYTGTGTQENTYLILCSGNVTMTTDRFEGIVIAGGDVTVKVPLTATGGALYSSNKEKINKLLQFETETTNPATGNKLTILEKYFDDSVGSAMTTADRYDENIGGFADYTECITYDNWTKR